VDSTSLAFFSICAASSVEELAPVLSLYLKPFQRAGLWLAVMIMAPADLVAVTA